MDLRERATQINDVMRKTKEDWVATKPENTDIAIYLHFWRGDDLVVTLQCEVNRDTAVEAGKVGAMGFGADTMAITFESFHSRVEKSPLTGNRWRPQEMQYVYETEPRNEIEHWVDACITTATHERGGAYVFSSNSYRIVKNRVEWGESVFEISSEDVDSQATGPMFEYLQNAMAQPTIFDRIVADAKENPISAMINNLVDDEEERLFHIDMATLRALNERKLIESALINAEAGSNREKLLAERLGNDGTWNVTRV